MLDVQIRVQVDLGRLDLFMTEPERYDRGVDPGAQQSHGGGMAQNVHSHRFLRQRRTGVGGFLDVFGKSVFKCVAAEGASGLRGEQRGCGLSGALGKPGAQDGDAAFGERRDPLLPSLSVATHMRARSEMDIGSAKADQLGGAKTGLHRECEQCRVPSPGPGHSIRGGEKRGDFHLGQEGHQPPIEALGRNGQNPVDDGGTFGMPKGRVSEQGTDRGKPRIAGARAVLSMALQMIEEGADQRRVEIVDLQLAWLAAFPLRGKDQQQPHRIAVGTKRVRADLTLTDKAIGEEDLQGRGERGHASPPR